MRPARWVAAFALAVGSCSGGETVAPVELEQVTSGEVLQLVAAPATVQPQGKRTVVSPAPAEVVELLVDDGAQVLAGQPVLRLASDAVTLAIEQAEAAVDAAGALARIPSGPSLSGLIGDVRGRLDEVVPPLLDTLAQEASIIPDEQVEAFIIQRLSQTRTAYDRAAAELGEAEARARAAEGDVTGAQRAAAQAQGAQAQLALDAAAARSGELTVAAPYEGVVEFSRVGAGGTAAGSLDQLLGGASAPLPAGGSGEALVAGSEIGAGQPLFVVYDLGGFHVDATVDEVDAVLVEEGQATEVLVDAFPDRVFAGTVAHVGVGPISGDTGGVLYPVRVTLDDPGDVRFRVGMTASIEVAVRSVDGDTVVPSRALLRRGGRDVVLLARDGEVAEVEVDVLALGEESAAVEGDVARGDEVVVSGFEGLEDGDPLP